MSNPFDFVNMINSSKKTEEYEISDYVPYIINRQFSYFPDTIHIANEMNLNSFLEKDEQFDFYINIVRPRKRFAKWSKPQKDENLVLISEVFECNMTKAKTIQKILSDEQIIEIRKKVDKGGLKK